MLVSESESESDGSSTAVDVEPLSLGTSVGGRTGSATGDSAVGGPGGDTGTSGPVADRGAGAERLESARVKQCGRGQAVG